MVSVVRHVRFLYLVGAAACWGVGTVVSKQALDAFAPMTLLVVQLASSTAFLLLLTRLFGIRLEWSRNLVKLAALGVLNPGIAYALALIGLTRITASMSVLIWAVEPAMILLLAYVVLGERLSPRLVAMVAVALAGVLLVVYQGGAAGDRVGVLVTVMAVLLCAVFTVVTRRLLVDDATVTVTLTQQGAALVFAVFATAAVELMGGHDFTVVGISGPAWVAAVLSGFLYYALAFLLYLSGLRHVSASVAGSFLTLIPVFGVSAAYLTGERLSPRQWVGAVLVVLAVAAITRSQRGGSGQTFVPASEQCVGADERQPKHDQQR